ncbi:hypothetical protein DSCW_04800 [Desulfosarcina widdelii]|uniref:PilZ domain-containing protein n=1 Tax=Desulfosarcina widdelii TaxID=947919 RepID=A0A5K7YYS0_9BACT|nr:hypothetical protein [Desulfosarcina widdelii]BBO73063.1 hypothetical protein DSCW_04800 [Desulfosarcina widdelii]
MAREKIPLYDLDRSHGDVGDDRTKGIRIERDSLRISTELAVTCRPYTSKVFLRTRDGIMRNFSCNGSYIETSYEFKPGTILIVQIISYPPIPASIPNEKLPKFLCLAEVKWLRELPKQNERKYGIGLRYLDE